MSARMSPKLFWWILAFPLATQALVRAPGDPAANASGSTFAGPTPPGGVAVQAQGPGGPAGAAAGAPGAPGQEAAGDGGGGGGSAKKSPGGAIGSNIKAVNAILNPDAKDKDTQSAPPPPDPMAQEDLRDMLLDISVGSYPGYCACPYSRNMDGFECGVEAAYYKPGGYRIDCYPQDLKGQDYIFYRKNH